jgi:tetratricopeptide (TPR) repeat protein
MTAPHSPSTSWAGGRLFRQATALVLLSVAAASASSAQDDPAVAEFKSARAFAMQGQADAAIAAFGRAAERARASDDKAMQVAALRGAAELLALIRPCTDSAERTLRLAITAANSGDRSAADALVRLLAARGNVAGARQALVAAYSDVPSLGRAITKESARYLQGQAAVEFASGHEAAALSALSQALSIAARLHVGDVSDTVARPTGAVDETNGWIMYDLGVLRLTAKSPSVRQLKAGASLLDLVGAAPALRLDGGEYEPYPILRLADRLMLQSRAAGSTTVPARGC